MLDVIHRVRVDLFAQGGKTRHCIICGPDTDCFALDVEVDLLIAGYLSSVLIPRSESTKGCSMDLYNKGFGLLLSHHGSEFESGVGSESEAG